MRSLSLAVVLFCSCLIVCVPFSPSSTRGVYASAFPWKQMVYLTFSGSFFFLNASPSDGREACLAPSAFAVRAVFFSPDSFPSFPFGLGSFLTYGACLLLAATTDPSHSGPFSGWVCPPHRDSLVFYLSRRRGWIPRISGPLDAPPRRRCFSRGTPVQASFLLGEAFLWRPPSLCKLFSSFEANTFSPFS